MRLLYPNTENINAHKFMPDDIVKTLTRDLEIQKLCDRIKLDPTQIITPDYIFENFTDNDSTIRYRQDISRDIYENNNLRSEFRHIYFLMTGLKEIRDDRTSYSDKDIRHHRISIKWLDLYCTVIEDLMSCFNKYKAQIKSEGLIEMSKLVKNLYISKEFQLIKENIKKSNKITVSPKSVCLGINLDEFLEPTTITCLSINDFYYQPQKLIQQKSKSRDIAGISRFHYTPTGVYTSIGTIKYDLTKPSSSLVNTTKIQRTLYCSIDIEYVKALNSFFSSLNFNSRNLIKNYIIDKAMGIIELIEDMGFLLAGAEFAKDLSEKGMPVSLPLLAKTDENNLSFKNIYNVLLVYIYDNPASDIVLNDLKFNLKNTFKILTGPNKGGKTTIVQAVSLALILFQLGLYTPCESAVVSPVDIILTHYQREEGFSKEGRLALETKSIKNIFRYATTKSFVIFNEPYVSTSPAEGVVLIWQSLKALLKIGSRGLLVTHYHGLAPKIQADSESDNSGIGFLKMEIETDGETDIRTYKLSVGQGNSISFAQDIVKEYAPQLLED